MAHRINQSWKSTGLSDRSAKIPVMLVAVLLGGLGALHTQRPATPAKPDRPAETPGGESQAPSSRRPDSRYAGYFPIGRGDVLDVAVFEEPQLSCECTVGPGGTIHPPLLKPVMAEGLTPIQLGEVVANDLRLAGLMSHPQVTVTVRSAPSSTVAVEGAVRSPQAIPVMGQTKLLTAVTQAGGLTDDAGDTATVYRGEFAMRNSVMEGEPRPQNMTADLQKLMNSGDPSQNVDLFPGDRVVVDRAGLFYVLGEVIRPGGYNLRSAHEHVTTLEALAIAGDVTAVAKKTRAVILRKDAKSSADRTQINVDLKAVLQRRAPDQQLQANDILYVPASGRKRAFHSATGTALSVAGGLTTGLIVYRR
jgi:polysaccharide biosynthesis/export protein